MSGVEGQAWQGAAGQDAARHGKAGSAGSDLVRRGLEGPGTAGGATLGKERYGLDGLGQAGAGRRGKAGSGVERPATNGLELAQSKEIVRIPEPNFKEAILVIEGTAPYVQHAFSQKARTKMEESQRAGARSKTRKTREARNFESDYEAAMHRSTEGWLGIPAPSFRNALISACKIVGFVMTKAKLAVFIIADGIDVVDGTPLVKIEGEPRIHQSYARNESGVADLRWRPMWEKWSAKVHIKWDADMFSAQDITNLMARAGGQVGIGEGRPDSPNSNGLGWGTFEVIPS
jgi:hypothetical protein